MSLPTIYARREPTTDTNTVNMIQAQNRGNSIEQVHRIAGKRYKDVQLYSDKECRKPVGRIPWYCDDAKGDRQTMMHNCAKYAVEWLEPVPDHLWPYFIMPKRNKPHLVAVLKEARLRGFYPAYDCEAGRVVLSTTEPDAILRWLEVEGNTHGAAVHNTLKIDADAKEYDVQLM